MQSSKLLWIADSTHAPAESDWKGPESGFAISRVTSLAHAAQVLQMEDFDCVLATGCFPDCGRLDVLETIHGVSASAQRSRQTADFRIAGKTKRRLLDADIVVANDSPHLRSVPLR